MQWKLTIYIEKDEYYNSMQYNKKIYRPLEILDGLDIKSLLAGYLGGKLISNKEKADKKEDK